MHWSLLACQKSVCACGSPLILWGFCKGIGLVTSLYSESECCEEYGKCVSSFHENVGARQGWVFAPSLFVTYMDRVLGRVVDLSHCRALMAIPSHWLYFCCWCSNPCSHWRFWWWFSGYCTQRWSPWGFRFSGLRPKYSGMEASRIKQYNLSTCEARMSIFWKISHILLALLRTTVCVVRKSYYGLA